MDTATTFQIKEDTLSHIDTDKLKANEWHWFVNRTKGYDLLIIFRKFSNGGRLVLSLDEAKFLNASQIINWGVLQQVGEPSWVSKRKGVVKAKGLYWNLNTPKKFDLEDLKDIQEPTKKTHWFSQNGPIPYEDLTNNHLANIVYQQVQRNYKLPTQIKEEVLSRFKYELVGNKFVKKLCCLEGLKQFITTRTLYGKSLEGRVVVNIQGLLNLLEKEEEISFKIWIAYIIKEAIKFYDHFYSES